MPQIAVLKPKVFLLTVQPHLNQTWTLPSKPWPRPRTKTMNQTITQFHKAKKCERSLRWPCASNDLGLK